MQKLLLVITILSTLAMVFGFTYSTDPEPGIQDEFLRKFNEANHKMTSIQSDFTQERHMQIMEEPIISTGKFYYKKPGLMKWDQLTPSPYYFIVRGEKVIRFDGKKRKELSVNNPQVSYFKNFIMSTIDGSIFESNQFETIYATKGDNYHVILTPKDKNMLKRIEKIILTFNNSTMALTELKILETGGDKMNITFTNQEFNGVTDNSIFE